MAFEWVDKVDDVDDIFAVDVNHLAQGIKDNEAAISREASKQTYINKGSYENFDKLTLNIDELVNAKVGYTWRMIEGGIIPSNFSITGEDITLNAGDKVTVEEPAVGYTIPPKFDVLAGTVDLSNYYSKDEVEAKIAEEAMISADVYAEKSDVYTKADIDNMLGDTETALDNIIAIQNELIGGEAV